ncbi:hypothetical protein HZB03_05900, partial [Candidatus Woesearchaeota archaeon]|nr:hypothetical protein [Candidatus Woesearchaeota archaeon]
ASEETIEDAEVNIDFTNTSSTVRLNKISYVLQADGAGGDDAYIMPGHGLREMLDEPQGMLGNYWDVRYEGLSAPGTSLVELKGSGDDEYRLSFENSQGVKYDSVRLLFANGATSTKYGDRDDNLWFTLSAGPPTNAGNYTIDKHDWFVLSHNGGTKTGVTRIMKLDSVDTSNNQLQLTDVGTGGQVTSQYTAANATCAAAGNCNGTLNVGGYTFDYTVLVTSGDSNDSKFKLSVDLDDDGTLGGKANVSLRGGGWLDLGTQTDANAPGNVNMTLWTDPSNFDEAPANPERFNISLTVASTKLDADVSSNAGVGLSPKTIKENDNVKRGMTNYGVLTEETNEDNDPDTIKIWYPLEQLLPQVFVTFEKTITKTGGSGTVTVEKPQRIEIGSALLASQVSDPKAANLVTVGGSCINSVTAEVLGKTYPACGEASGLSEGEAVLKLVESGTNVALVVAGWSADDTTRATRVLADFKTHQASGKLKGSEVKVTGTSLTQFTVTPVEVPAAPAAAAPKV